MPGIAEAGGDPMLFGGAAGLVDIGAFAPCP